MDHIFTVVNNKKKKDKKRQKGNFVHWLKVNPCI